MVGWHHQLNGHEFEQAPGDGGGQGGLACCSPWDRKELNTAEQLNNKAKTVTVWLGSPDSPAVFTRHCTFEFLFISIFTKLS